MSDNAIQRTMKKTNEKGKLINLFRQKKFVESDFKDDLDRIIEKYNEKGYRDAKICGLRSFEHTQFEGYGVAVDVFFYRHELIEQITAVHIQVCHCVVILKHAFVEQLLVVDVAGTYVEYLIKHFGGEYCVAHPVYVADIIFLALFKNAANSV